MIKGMPDDLSRQPPTARNRALEGCRKDRPQANCVIVLENNDWIGSMQ
jgi:hypothetical protein